MYKFPYEWYLKDNYKDAKKNNLNVFGTFICGGGSTMGYKLAGYNHLGGVEIDTKVAEVYKLNHNPKYLFNEDIREFNKRTDLPNELYNLDILDGSPPCSTFSMAGLREKAWGKEKVFREGQSKQVLDDLVFVYVETILKLKPKVAILENVKGIIQANAKSYCLEIKRRLELGGYNVQINLLNSASMGVPQMRERVFFICSRKDLNLDKLELNFKEKPITYGEIRIEGDTNKQMTDYDMKIWNNRIQTDTKYADTLMRIENRNSNFNTYYVKDSGIVNTITSTTGSKLISFEEPKHLSNNELCKAGTYPMDYNFGKVPPKYLIGMSVPPVMIAQIATKIKEQWF